METKTASPELDMFAAPRKWYQIWWDVWTHPGSQVFRDLITEKDITAGRAFTWVAVTSFIAYLAAAFSVWRGLSVQSVEVVEYTTSIMVCFTIVAPVVAVITLAISAALYHWIAHLFKGSGSWEKLVFCLATIQAPVVLFSILLSFMGVSSSGEVQATSSPLLLCVGWIVALVLSIVTIVLYVSAIQAVEQLDGVLAAVTYFAPPLVVLLVVGCFLITMQRSMQSF